MTKDRELPLQKSTLTLRFIRIFRPLRFLLPAIALCACSQDDPETIENVVAVDRFAEVRRLAVSDLAIQKAAGTAIQLTWSPHRSEDVTGYFVARRLDDTKTNTLVPQFALAVALGPAIERTTFDENGHRIDWLKTSQTAFDDNLAIAGHIFYTVYAEFPDGTLSSSAGPVSAEVSAPTEITGTVSAPPAPSDPDDPDPDPVEPCLTLQQIAHQLHGFRCFNVVNYTSASTEGVWDDNDLVASSRSWHAASSPTNLTAYTLYPGIYRGDANLDASFTLGPDNLVGTDDDRLFELVDRRLPAGEVPRQIRDYRIPENADCVFLETGHRFIQTFESPNAAEQAGIVYSGDDIVRWQRRFLNATAVTAAVTEVIEYTLPGDDFAFLTADDYAKWRERFWLNDNLHVTFYALYAPGPDALFGTADDFAAAVAQYLYEDDYPIRFDLYSGAPNGTTTHARRFDYTYEDASGNLTEIRELAPNGVTRAVAVIETYACPDF